MVRVTWEVVYSNLYKQIVPFDITIVPTRPIARISQNSNVLASVNDTLTIDGSDSLDYDTQYSSECSIYRTYTRHLDTPDRFSQLHLDVCERQRCGRWRSTTGSQYITIYPPRHPRRGHLQLHVDSYAVVFRAARHRQHHRECHIGCVHTTLFL